MKKCVAVFIFLVCCCFFFCNHNNYVYCSANNVSISESVLNYNETLEFYYKNRIFTYNLASNIPQSCIFTNQIKINNFNRFANKNERKILLEKLLKLNFNNKIIMEYMFPNLTNLINRIEKNINIKEVNAKLKINSNQEKPFKIYPEKKGIKVNTDLLIKNIFEKFLSDNTLIFQIPTIDILPQTHSYDLKKFTNLRGDFSTSISSSNNERKHNIKNAINSLNLIEIHPNQEFSFNKIVGRRTKENGYKEAKIIVNNEFVEGLGGGVCQVSSTLYNTALLSGLKITEANKHSKQVSYVKYGFDAMVNYGSSDLKFINNTNEKIIIIANYNPNKIRIRIFGEDLKGTSFKLTNEIVSKTEAKIIEQYDYNQEYLDKVTYDDEFFFLKTPSNGMEIKSYLEIYNQGVLQQTKLLRFDKFNVQNGVKIYGVKKRAGEEICTF